VGFPWLLGILSLGPKRSEEPYSPSDVRLLQSVAAQTAIALENSQLTAEIARESAFRARLSREIEIAREVQEGLFPQHFPPVNGIEYVGFCRPALGVGGDYYDFVKVGEQLGIAVGDISGKGIPAALLMAGFRMSLLAEIRNEFAIRAVMRKVNTLIHESTDRDKFVTVFYGVLDFKHRALIFSNGGHNPPILMRRDGTIEYLVEGGVALGVLSDARYEERPIALHTGDVLVLYTDGVSEAESATQEQFGTQRLEQCVARDMGRSAQEILDAIVAEVEDWCGEAGPNDDLTLIVVKAVEPAPKNP